MYHPHLLKLRLANIVSWVWDRNWIKQHKENQPTAANMNVALRVTGVMHLTDWLINELAFLQPPAHYEIVKFLHSQRRSWKELWQYWEQWILYFRCSNYVLLNRQLSWDVVGSYLEMFSTWVWPATCHHSRYLGDCKILSRISAIKAVIQR